MFKLTAVDLTSSSLFLHKSCEDLKEGFLSLQDAHDVAVLLDIPYSQLIYHTSRKFEKKRYSEFKIPKKSGQHRLILAPITSLKIIQRKLSQILYSVYEPKASVHGFVSDRSILTNAQQHSNKRYVLNIDLEDFFHTIHFGRVKGMFMKPPYNLPETVAVILAKISCHIQSVGEVSTSVLPQGAPSSPIISNMICSRLDSELRRLSKESRCFYTRYCDDITFSTRLSKMSNDLILLGGTDGRSSLHLGEKLKSIIKENGFQINERKTRLQHKSSRQEVTGLIVNESPNVRRELVKEVRAMLHVWDKFGLEVAEEHYLKKISISREINTQHGWSNFKGIPEFKEVVRGKINFIGMVKGKEDKVYLRHLKWLHELLNRIS